MDQRFRKIALASGRRDEASLESGRHVHSRRLEIKRNSMEGATVGMQKKVDFEDFRAADDSPD